MPEPLKWYDDNADNREFFLNKPYGIGGRMKDDIP